MTVYLGVLPNHVYRDDLLPLFSRDKPPMLQSFWYDTSTTLESVSDDIMIDSGAFSMLCDKKKKVPIEEYADEYCEFIRRHNFSKFLELDLDSIIGYENTLKIRRRIEDSVGKQTIPVWHRQRGLDDYNRMCDEYKYVAIGGIAINEIKVSEYPYLKKLIAIAHAKGCSVHGLGFTRTSLMHEYRWDSIDSTSWKSGWMYGFSWRFTGKKMQLVKPKNKKLIATDIAIVHDLKEWLKYVKFARDFL